MMLAARPIGELVDSVEAWNPKAAADSTFCYVDLGAVDHIEKAIVGARTLSGSDAPSRARQIVRTGDILVSTVRPNLNAVAVVPASFDGATVSTGFCVLRPRLKSLESRYLFHWVRSPGFIDQLTRRATGASYPAISDSIVLDSKIPYAEPQEQRRIADILDKTDALRAKRRSALAQLDSLARAVFLDMFGDPMRNPRRWPSAKVADLATVVTGNTPSRVKPEYYGTDIEWIKSDNISPLAYYVTPAKERLSRLGKSVARVVPPRSILVTCIAGSPNSIGNTAMTDREVAFNQQINALAGC